MHYSICHYYLPLDELIDYGMLSIRTQSANSIPRATKQCIGTWPHLIICANLFTQHGQHSFSKRYGSIPKETLLTRYMNRLTTYKTVVQPGDFCICFILTTGDLFSYEFESIGTSTESIRNVFVKISHSLSETT